MPLFSSYMIQVRVIALFYKCPLQDFLQLESFLSVQMGAMCSAVTMYCSELQHVCVLCLVWEFVPNNVFIYLFYLSCLGRYSCGGS